VEREEQGNRNAANLASHDLERLSKLEEEVR
jgi:hypothetical protein